MVSSLPHTARQDLLSSDAIWARPSLSCFVRKIQVLKEVAPGDSIGGSLPFTYSDGAPEQGYGELKKRKMLRENETNIVTTE